MYSASMWTNERAPQHGLVLPLWPGLPSTRAIKDFRRVILPSRFPAADAYLEQVFEVLMILLRELVDIKAQRRCRSHSRSCDDFVTETGQRSRWISLRASELQVRKTWFQMDLSNKSITISLKEREVQKYSWLLA